MPSQVLFLQRVWQTLLSPKKQGLCSLLLYLEGGLGLLQWVQKKWYIYDFLGKDVKGYSFYLVFSLFGNACFRRDQHHAVKKFTQACKWRPYGRAPFQEPASTTRPLRKWAFSQALRQHSRRAFHNVSYLNS